MHTRTSFCGSRPSELRSVSLPNRPHVRIAVHSFIYGHNGGYYPYDAVGWKIIIPGKKATQSRPRNPDKLFNLVSNRYDPPQDGNIFF